MGDLARGTFKLPTARPRIRFRDHAIWYRDTISVQHRGVTREISMVNSLIKAFEEFWLDQMEPSTIEDWKTLRATEVGKSTVNRELEILKPLLDKAIPKYLDENPARGTKRFRTPKFVPITIFNFSAEDAILAVATPEERAFYLLGTDSLMRLGDVRRFHIADDHGTYLEVVDPKTATPYKVPISKRLRKALDARSEFAKAHDGFFFSRRKKAGKWRPISGATAFTMFVDLCARANVPRGRAIRGVTFHSTRHTGATRATRQVGVNVTRRLGGWSTLEQLVRYDHPDESDFIRGVEAIGARPAAANVHDLSAAAESRVVHAEPEEARKPAKKCLDS
jgi:integrase